MSTTWKYIVNLSSVEGVQNLAGFEACQWIVGNGSNVLFWFDQWLLMGPFLSNTFLRLFSLCVNKEAKVSNLWNRGSLNIPFRRTLFSSQYDTYTKLLDLLAR
ncbi:Uncharacterized protein TCM_020146 [Theobroma cacao]|uniref:Reverse transcriptase zinc-binding domain-containing protein n=1 Tax=Theobroma cacao TaxID=3641 RepID=A0A061EJI8_THECC|nr:Uncharacterized protein TCM_020146 [Theobroma cacao]